VKKAQELSFLGTLTKLQKATVSFITIAWPFVCMEQLDLHWTDFHEILCQSIFAKSVMKIQVSLNRNKNNRYIA
jgi:hypothetical protein